MARDASVLTSSSPTAVISDQVHIGHVQLRDLVICPRERGIVNYVQRQSIVEQNLHVPGSTRTLAELNFSPNTLTSLSIGDNDTLIAAGGQDAEIHLSYHSTSSSRHRRSNLVWQFERHLYGSINNSVLLTSLNLGCSNESSVEPRVGISNNDCTVKLYDVPIRGLNQKRTIKEAGSLRLDVPINHSSISPDGRTLLSVGDSNKVYFHAISGGGRLTFSPLCILSLPSPTTTAPLYHSNSLAASFSTAFSADGAKFAVASQEGVVTVWDVRSTKPLKVYETDKTRLPSGSGNGGATGWMSDDPWEWTRGSSKAPGWSVRSVKFSAGPGHETMAFTEHTSFMHVVDARTFETEEIIRVPIAKQPKQPPPQPPARSPTLSPRPTPARRRTAESSLPTWPPSRVSTASPPHFFSSRPGSSLTSRLPAPASSSRPQSRILVANSNALPIVQALGDAFRIPGHFSPPASISDSTWRTLRRSVNADGDSANGGTRDVTSDLVRDLESERRSRTAEQARRRRLLEMYSTMEDVNEDEPLSTRDQDDLERRRPQELRDYHDLLLIPPLGDRDVESEVHALLEMHGISARRHSYNEDDMPDRTEDDDEGRADGDDEVDDADINTGSTHAEYEYQMGGSASSTSGQRRRPLTTEGPSSSYSGHRLSSRALRPRTDEDMDVDDVESDCASSHTVSRSSSPNASNPGIQRRIGDEDPASRIGSLRTGPSISRVEVEYVDDLDISGVCFDPSGSHVYAASTEGVVEWGLRGAEKRWSFGVGWK